MAKSEFHHTLRVSALGPTLVHQSMGLDNRNRVDVALNPDEAEGLWLRRFLERLHVPYLAFRSALPRAATAPHIHIGTGSTRPIWLNGKLSRDSVENHTTTRATSLIGVIWTAYPRRCSWRTNARLRF